MDSYHKLISAPEITFFIANRIFIRIEKSLLTGIE